MPDLKTRDKIIDALRTVWDRYPSLRFGQLIDNVYRVRKERTDSHADLFYFGDEEFFEAFWDYVVE